MRLSVIANQEIHDLPMYGDTRLTDERQRAATLNDCQARAMSRRQPCRGKPAPHTYAGAKRWLLHAEEDTPAAVPRLDVVAFAVGDRGEFCEQLSL